MFKKEIYSILDFNLPVYSVNTLIIGSGAAALNCADHLYSFGVKDILLVTDYFGGGASNLSGSDKQTFYKLSLSGDSPDCPGEMAKTFFDGFCMHGDIALIEATLSSQEFFHLCSIGVEFPHNKFGGYTGYKTDHDPRQRATSAGPRTSNQMVQRLSEQIRNKGIPVLDKMEIVTLLTKGEGDSKIIIGAIGINKNEIESDSFGLTIFNCENLILGVGGPGGIYKTSVYPEGQIGSIGLAIEIGAISQNLTESQYGLASIKYRWNVSGTYQQVIPSYVSSDQNGYDFKHFLNPYFPNMGKLATDIFLKGYQWPFDSRKIQNFGSSIVDILVYQETVIKNRRAYLDFRINPVGSGQCKDFTFDDLEPEAFNYLKNSDALFGNPIERLQKMNPLSIDLYKEQNIDITKEPLEIAVCAQHNNGGLTGDIWWQSNIKNMFPVGEVNGSHGVYRPGGAALNSGQVGGYRAAQYISVKGSGKIPDLKIMLEYSRAAIERKIKHIKELDKKQNSNSEFASTIRNEIQNRMTAYGSHIREYSNIKKALSDAYSMKKNMFNNFSIKNRKEILPVLQNEMLWLTHVAYLESIKEYLDQDGGSRGSYLVMDEKGEKISDYLDSSWKFKKENPDLRSKILTIQYQNDKFKLVWVPVRNIPKDDFWYENVWRDYRERKIYD